VFLLLLFFKHVSISAVSIIVTARVSVFRLLFLLVFVLRWFQQARADHVEGHTNLFQCAAKISVQRVQLLVDVPCYKPPIQND